MNVIQEVGLKIKILSLLIGGFLLLQVRIFGQGSPGTMDGEVSFVTSHNVYVKFDSTSLINAGDTLFLLTRNEAVPCLIVHHKSSFSCACTPFYGCDIKKGNKIRFIKKEENNELVVVKKSMEETILKDSLTKLSRKLLHEEKGPEAKLFGKMSVASYSTLSTQNDDRHRLAYRLNFAGTDLNDSKISFDTYVAYWQNFRNDTLWKFDQNLRIYSASVAYQLNNNLSFRAGRMLNQRASSLGALDGAQGEYFIKNKFVGVLAGFAPDYTLYRFNFNLLMTGAYGGLVHSSKIFAGSTTFGVMEQRNHFNLDRRFSYLQHSSTLWNKLNVYATAEVDLYNLVNGEMTTNLKLTNLYASLSYRPTNKIRINLSYDTRKQIIYYETFKTELENMLEDDLARQGLRLMVNARLFKVSNFGLSIAQRFQSDQQNASNNINLFYSLNAVPVIKGSLLLNANRNVSNYLLGDVYSARYYRDISRKSNVEFYYRWAHYTYHQSEYINEVQYLGLGWGLRFSKKYTFNILCERSIATDSNGYRINTRISKRF